MGEETATGDVLVDFKGKASNRSFPKAVVDWENVVLHDHLAMGSRFRFTSRIKKMSAIASGLSADMQGKLMQSPEDVYMTLEEIRPTSAFHYLMKIDNEDNVVDLQFFLLRLVTPLCQGTAR